MAETSIRVAIGAGDQSIVRTGFNVFYEVGALLRQGQARENAHVPALDKHSALLRWVLFSIGGVRLVEVLPIPPGFDFMVCLTHDVDFVALRDHRCDHTMRGFL